MKNYNLFTVEEFMQDSYFRQWALNELMPEDVFWENWVNSNHDKLPIIEEAKSLVIALKIKDSLQFSEDEINDGMNQILMDTSPQTYKLAHLRSNNNWLRIAASITLILGFTWLIGLRYTHNSVLFSPLASYQKQVSYINNGTQPITFELSDGSKITLEPKSQLLYGNEFGKNKREVYLTGEAFFDVAKDTQHPFLIYTAELVTKVVGTSFRIKAYENDKDISVSVQTGKVTVYSQNTDRRNNPSFSTEMVLAPNQKAVFEKEEKRLAKTLVDVPLELQKLPDNTSFHFEETNVNEIFSRLELVYGVKITYDKNSFKKYSVTADLKNESLFKKLDLICEIIQAHYEIVDGEIMIYEKSN